MPRVLIIPSFGPITETYLSDYRDYQLVVDGPIEFVGTPFPGCSAYINEVGKLQHLSRNQRATRLTTLRAGDFIAGPMILVGFDSNTGEDLDCPLSVKDVQQVVLYGQGALEG